MLHSHEAVSMAKGETYHDLTTVLTTTPVDSTGQLRTYRQ